MKNFFIRNQRGQGIIELALTLPILFLLGFGIFEFGRSLYTKNVIINMSREGANLYSRVVDTPQDIMDALAVTAAPLDMQNFGMMYLSTVEGTDSGAVILEQEAWDDAPAGFTPPSKIGDAPSPGNPEPDANIPALTLEEGEIAKVVEVFYDYNVIFGGIINYEPEIYAQSAF